MGGKDGRRLIEPRKRGKRGRVGVSVVIDENNVFSTFENGHSICEAKALYKLLKLAETKSTL